MSLLSGELKGYTGGLLEGEVFPHCTPVACTKEYLPFRKAMEASRVNQPAGWSDPTDPPTTVANNIHYLTAQELFGDCSSEHLKQLRIYSATGTPLDRFHGVDFWLEYNGRIATGDLTCNPHKVDGYKADVIVFFDGDMARLKQAAEEFAGLLR